MEIRVRLQCKLLKGREKSRRRKNNAKQWKEQWETMKKQCEEQWEERWNSRKSARLPTSGDVRGEAGNGAAREAGPVAKSKARPKRWGFGRANVTLHLMPCTARAGNASGIRSIPAIHSLPRSTPRLDLVA
jgi:hypothetical protein